jgi:FG-GAP-like repeat
VPFAALPPSAAGTTPIRIAAADLDGDGRVDLATANGDDGHVWVLHGNGAGQFTPAPVDVGASPRTLAVADFNGDSRPDIAAPRFLGNDVAVLLGGSFALAPSPFGTGVSPRFVATADFNHDLHADLATVDLSAPSLSIGIGDGAGGFSPLVGTPLGMPHGSTGLVAADFNGDTNPDLAIANADDGTVTTLLGDGVSSLNAQTPVPAGQATGPLVAADFNADGKPDLAVADAHNVVTLLGDGTGAFAAPVITAAAGGLPNDIAVGDFDRDGRRDLAVVNPGAVTVLLGDGDGTFTAQPPIAVGGMPQSAAVADFDGDGWPDIAVTQMLAGTVTVLANWSGPHAELSPAGAQDLGTAVAGSIGAARTFTVTAGGTEPLHVGAVGTSGTGFRIAHDGCSLAVLGVGSSCTVRVEFAPSVAGAHAGTLSVPSNGPAAGVSLSATGTAPAPPPVARCVPRRSLVIHPPKAMRGGRVTVTLRGRVIKRVKRAGRAVKIRLAGKPEGVLRVTMKHGRKRIVRTFHTCVPQRRR